MLELRGCLYLREKPLGAEGSGEIRVEDFDRDVAVVAEVMSEIDGRHAAGADFAVEAVFGVKCVG